MTDQSHQEALATIAVYATRQAEHHEHDGLGEARAWRYVAFTATDALGGGTSPMEPLDPAELMAALQTVRRRLRSHVDPVEVVAFIDQQLDSATPSG